VSESGPNSTLDTAQASGDRLAALWTVAAYSGSRQGELLGLKWDDVDFDRSAITIRRILVKSAACVPQYGEPKTRKSQRAIALPNEAISALRGHKASQNKERLAAGADWADCGLVFASHIGTPLLRRNVLRDYKRALARAGIPDDFRFHDLRHAHATLMFQAVVSAKAVSERLGHSNIGIMMDLYTHAVQSMDVDAAERIQRALRG
jgi:integrase